MSLTRVMPLPPEPVSATARHGTGPAAAGVLSGLPEDRFFRSTEIPPHGNQSRGLPTSADRWLAWLGTPFITSWPVKWPLLALLSLTLLLHLSQLDIGISALFYDRATGAWPWFFSRVCIAFYRGGVYPPMLLAGFGFYLTLASVGRPARRNWHRAGIFLLLVLGLGPGLIVNYGFKQFWGRPRPHQIMEFGGQEQFAPVGQVGSLTRMNSSFPSGHAAVAFYMIAPAFIVDSRRRQLANGLLIAGLVFGFGMGVTRVVQGGHFVSDVIWSAGIVYFLCVICARLLLRPRVVHADLLQRPGC